MYRRYTDGVPHPPLVSEYEGVDSGGVPDLFALCEALHVELFSLPGDDELERGME